MSHPIRCTGFTLIELLVVIAVIGVLAAMLLGVVGMVRDGAKGIDCMSKLRQLGLAAENYTSENEGLCFQPQASYSPFVTNTNVDPEWGMWPGRIMPYLTTSFRGSTASFNSECWNRYFNCPSGNWTVAQIKALADQGIGHGVNCVWTTSYGMNTGWRGHGLTNIPTNTVGSQVYEQYRLASFKLPSATILLGEKWGVADNTSPAIPDDRPGVTTPMAVNSFLPVPPDWPRQTAPPSPGSTSASVRQSHRGRTVLLFVDIHVGRHRLAETWNGTNGTISGWWAGVP